MEVSPLQIVGFVLVLFRSASLVMAAPILSASSVSTTIRLSLAFAIALCVFFLGGMPAVAAPTLSQILPLIFVELAVGAGSALAARAMLEAASTAGHLAGTGIGMSFSSMMDPSNGSESNAAAQLFSIVGLAFAVALGVHKEAIGVLLWTFRDGGLTPAVDLQDVLQRLIVAFSSSIVVGIRLGFPVLCAATFGHLALGVLGRASPQLSLQSLGFTVAVLSGGWALYITVPEVGYTAAELARSALAQY